MVDLNFVETRLAELVIFVDGVIEGGVLGIILHVGNYERIFGVAGTILFYNQKRIRPLMIR